MIVTAFINTDNRIYNFIEQFGYNSTPKLKIYVRNNIIKSQILTDKLFINHLLTPDDISQVHESRRDLYDNYLTEDVFNLYFFNNYFMCTIDSTVSNNYDFLII